MRKRITTYIIFLSVCFTQDYIIDDYYFSWKVFQFADIEFNVNKDEDKCIIAITDDNVFSNLSLNAKEAIELGEELSNTNTVYKKLKKNEMPNIQEQSILPNYTVTYKKSEKYGFSISIKENEGWSSSFNLDRKEALALVPYLKDADNLINHINKNIEPE